ncbi:hypothetical protein AMV146 [Betaentomopoxvirus amoorei]|uniref:AMV146 n=1 Tax=Amsacta moorei entomopoxvirus TaxID=28321 RepID=Q9EMQ3_AMEPV|nr:hypothetical protein AMV146 [Amsacta moorei entomopoxvirus]AAG02852.1 AMV146 [Amsacta moorei entomopoxvirus]
MLIYSCHFFYMILFLILSYTLDDIKFYIQLMMNQLMVLNFLYLHYLIHDLLFYCLVLPLLDNEYTIIHY